MYNNQNIFAACAPLKLFRINAQREKLETGAIAVFIF